MENATIGYKGMSSVPSDYLCEDGDMKLAVDAEVRDGSYHATRVPKDSCFHVDGFYPKFYHEPSDGKKYFIGLRHDGDKWVLAAYDKDGEKVEIENAPEGDEEDVFGNFCAMGNLVCLTLYKKIVSLQYKNYYYKYIDILKKPIGIKFGAKLESYKQLGDEDSTLYTYEPGRKKVTYTGNLNPASVPYEYRFNEFYCPTTFTEDNLKADDSVFAAFNTAVKENLSTCKFMFPVLLKYAVKLYSGEYINVSPPILLFPYPDNTIITNYNGDVHVVYDSYSIYYSLTDEAKKLIEQLKSLDNLVESIDVFITPQIYDIRTDHVVENEFAVPTSDSIRFIKTKAFYELYKQSSFYLIKSWTLEDFAKSDSYENGTVYFPMLYTNGDDEIKLTTLEQQTVLSASTYSNSDIYSDHISVYNSRLLASNISKGIVDLWPIDILCPPILGYGDKVEELIERETGQEPIKFLRSNTYCNLAPYGKVAVEVNSQSTTDVVSDYQGFYLPLYFEYPMDGYGAFYFSSYNSGQMKIKKIKLHKSQYNTAAYYSYPSKAVMEMDEYIESSDSMPEETSNAIYYHNLIKESNVNDPFTFKDGNSCECGKGSVIAVASMSSPTSQGQFGQYPLFAFCTDGIYAIGIGSDGTIQNCSPYSTDILAGEEALANVGRDIVFASKAGVMSIGEEGRSLLLPAIKEELYGYDNERQKTFVSKVLTDMGVPLPDTTNVYTYITNGVRMAYDYQHGRVILYNPNYGYSYVLDAQSKSWSIMTKQFKDHLNPVAECLMVAPDGQTLHDYSTDEVVDEHGAFLMTRPFKMEAANVMKTIHSLIQRGNLRSKDAVQQALYGSRDLVNWVPIWSSKDIYLRGFRGTGYKYFRLLVFLPEMTQNDSIDGATISYLPRETDQQR